VNKIRSYTDKTRLRGFQSPNFALVRVVRSQLAVDCSYCHKAIAAIVNRNI
jgi:hypothetical protein